jgi:hypothetical protein
MPSPGTAFWPIGAHPWVVISRTIKGKVLAVNITDSDHIPNSPCKLNVGDHPCISKPSAIYYKKAREFDAAKIDQELISGKKVNPLAPCSQSLLNRIIRGAKDSDDLPPKFLDYL